MLTLSIIWSLLVRSKNNNINNIVILGVIYASIIAFTNLCIELSVSIYGSMVTVGGAIDIMKVLILIWGLLYLCIIKSNTNLVIIALISIWSITMMLSANDMIMIFILIELQSYCVYVMTVINKDKKSVRNSVRYYILGSIGSLIVLLGFSTIYSDCGMINISSVRLTKCSELGVFLSIIGLMIKIGIFPIQNWIVNVYGDLRNEVALWISLCPKVSILILIYKLSTSVPLSTMYIGIINVLIIFTMIAGAVGGLGQLGVKRILAYSGVLNTGYILMAIMCTNDLSMYSMVYYIAQYGFNHVLIFMAVIFISTEYKHYINYIKSTDIMLSGLSGLVTRNKGLFLAITISIASFIGIPPTVGFNGKVSILQCAMMSGEYLMAIILIVLSIVSGYYYIYIVKSSVMANEVCVKELGKSTYAYCYTISTISLLTAMPILYQDIYQNSINISTYYGI